MYSYNFPGADGDLIGRDGWVASEIGDPSPAVISNQGTSPTQGEYSAAQPGAFGTLNPAADWYVEVVANFHGDGVLARQIQFWWGDITSAALAVYFNIQGTGAGNLDVEVIDAAGTNISGSYTLASPAADHEFKFAAEAGDLKVYIDDVLIVTVAGAVLAPVTNQNFVLFLYTDPLAGIPTVSSIEISGP